MAGNDSKYPPDKPSEVIDYIKRGLHAFVGCDDESDRDSFVESLQVTLDGEIQVCIDGRAIMDCTDFAANVVAACQSLVFALGIPCLQRRLSIATSLEEAMEAYSEGGRQGYLILNEMDNVIEMQRTFELEGPLRSVMQLHDDVAVVIVASNDTINGLVGDYDRPFYMSFRVFRL